MSYKERIAAQLLILRAAANQAIDTADQIAAYLETHDEPTDAQVQQFADAALVLFKALTGM